MKAKYSLVVLLVAALALFTAGCGEFESKMTTGGGWFCDQVNGHKISFGFSARPTGDDSASGHFRILDHDYRTRVNGSFTGTYSVDASDASIFAGTCQISGELVFGEKKVPGYFGVYLRDGGPPGKGVG